MTTRSDLALAVIAVAGIALFGAADAVRRARRRLSRDLSLLPPPRAAPETTTRQTTAGRHGPGDAPPHDDHVTEE